MTTSEKIVENTTLAAIARLAMIITPFLFAAVATLFWGYIGEIKADASTAADSAASLQTRVSVIEDNQKSGLAERLRFQDQVLATLTDINKTLTEQGKQLAALAATIEAAKVKR